MHALINMPEHVVYQVRVFKNGLAEAIWAIFFPLMMEIHCLSFIQPPSRRGWGCGIYTYRTC